MRKRLLCLLYLLFLIACMVPAYADVPPPPPTPWYRELGDGLVFHYRPEEAHYHEHVFHWGTPAEFAAQGYPQTGLYRDGVLIYTVEEPIWGMLYFANDGMSFLEIDWWAPASGDPGILMWLRMPIGPAVRFFEQGAFVHSYDVLELVADQNSLVFSVNHVQWDYQNERYHDQENNTLRVETRDGRSITFDLSTGLIVSNQRVPIAQRIQRHLDDPWFWDNFFGNPVVGWTIILVFVSMITLVVVIIVRKRRRKK